MSTEFYNSQWQMPNEANKNKSSNYSLDFDGTSQYIQLNSSVLLPNQHTISTWIKSNDLTSSAFGYLFSTEGTIKGIGLDEGDGSYGAGKFYYWNGSVNMLSTTAITVNNWHHIVFVFDSTANEIKFYLDGNLDKTTTVSIGIAGSLKTIGSYVGSLHYLNGKLDAFSIFDYALSQSQVTTLYGDSINGVGNPMDLSPTPKAYYKLSDSVWNGTGYITPNNAVEGSVFDFDGNDSIDTNFTLPNYNSYSISVWYKKDRGTVGVLPAGDHYLWGNATSGGANKPRTSVRFNDTNELRIITGDGTVYFQSPDLNVSTLLLDGKWHHILTTTVSGEIKLYIDGDLQATHTNSNIITGIVAETSYRIGQSGYNAGYLTESLLSNFQIFNTALSGPEVETLYNYGSPIQTLANIPQSSNLKAWYKLDATEIYNSSITDWEVNNALSPWTSSLNFNRARSASISLGSSSSIRPTGDYTISIWYNLNSTVNAGVWCAGSNINNSGLTLFSSAQYAGGLALYHKGGSGTSAQVNLGSGSIVVNNWHNAIFTYDDTSRVIKGYLNGDLISTVNVSGTGSVNWSNSFYLGRLIQNGSYYLDGRLSNFQIFNTKLEETGSNSVETLYNSGNPLTDMSSFSSLVSWWKLNNTTTGIEDSKGSNNGTNNKATEAPGSVSTLNGLSSGMSQSNLTQSDLQTVAPYSKYALSFDGTNDYIQTGGFTIGNNYTFSCWLKSDTTSPSNMCFLSSPNYYTIGYDGNFVIRFTTATQIQMFSYNERSDSESSTVTIPSIDTNWHHFALTSNGTTTNIYWDGSLLTVTGNQTKSLDNISQGLIIGDNITGNNNAFNGSISNVSIFDSALTSSQVREIYNEGLPSNLNTFSGTAPVAWWQLGEGVSYDNTNLYVRDYMGSNHGISTSSMDQANIVHGVGTSKNGVGSGFYVPSPTVTNIFNGPYSDKNALSINMQSAKANSGIDTSTPQAT